MSIGLRLNISTVMQSSVGRRDGISEAQLAGLQRQTKRIHESVKRRRQAGELACYDLPYMRESIIEVVSFAGEQIGRFENYVHVGSRGSSLAPRALHGALNHPFHNYFSPKDRGGYPRLFFIDNFDPDTLSGLLAVIDPRQTLFNIVSKSGNSPETNASFLYFLAALKKKLGYAWNRQVVFTTHPEDGDLRAISKAERIKTFAIHPAVDERFFLLTPVGLLPAAFSGIDVHGLLNGAIEMDGACRAVDIFKNPAYLLGATLFLLDTLKGKKSVSMRADADCLAQVVPWFHWLWKGERESPKTIADATLKFSARRANPHENADFVREDDDKVFVLLSVQQSHHQTILPVDFLSRSSFQAIAGKTGEEVLQQQQGAKSKTLVSARRPHLNIAFPAVRPETVGEFVYMMHVLAVYSEELYLHQY